jgi:hypothetical protein
MRRLPFVLLAFLAPVVSWGAFCTHDVAPAATLLVPYIAIDMVGDAPDPSGAATLLRVTNTAPEATLIQLTVWSADGQAVIGLTQVLSGYDMWTINFRDLLTGNWSAFDTSRAGKAPPNVDAYPLSRKTFEWGPDGRSPFDYPPIPAPYNIPYPSGLPVPEKTTVILETGCGMPYGKTTGAQYAPLIVAALQAPPAAMPDAGRSRSSGTPRTGSARSPPTPSSSTSPWTW